jgi:hypothetical protein
MSSSESGREHFFRLVPLEQSLCPRTGAESIRVGRRREADEQEERQQAGGTDESRSQRALSREHE